MKIFSQGKAARCSTDIAREEQAEYSYFSMHRKQLQNLLTTLPLYPVFSLKSNNKGGFSFSLTMIDFFANKIILKEGIYEKGISPQNETDKEKSPFGYA